MKKLLTLMAIGSGGIAIGASFITLVSVPGQVQANEIFYQATGVSCSSCHSDASRPTKAGLTPLGVEFRNCKQTGGPRCNENAKLGEDRMLARANMAPTTGFPGATPYPTPYNPSTQRPNPTYQPPATTYQPPATTYQPPATTYQPPATTYQPPNPTYQPPNPTYQPPNPTYQPPNPTYQPPYAATQPVAPPVPPQQQPQPKSSSFGQFLGGLIAGLTSGNAAAPATSNNRPNNAAAPNPPISQSPRFVPTAAGYNPGDTWYVVQRMGNGRVLDSLWRRQPGSPNLFDATFMDSGNGQGVRDVVEYVGFQNGQITFRRRGTGTVFRGDLNPDGARMVSGTMAGAPPNLTWTGLKVR